VSGSWYSVVGQRIRRAESMFVVVSLGVVVKMLKAIV